VKLPAHPVKTGQAGRGLPERKFPSSCAPSCLPVGRDPACKAGSKGTFRPKGRVKGICMGEIAKTFVKGIHLINSALRYVCMSLLFFMMVLGTCDVMGRYLFNKPILGTFEVFEILLPAIVLLGLSYTQGNNGHVRVELFISHLSVRRQTVLSFVTNGLALFISVLILWRGYVLATGYWRMGRTIPTIEVPMFLPQLLVPLGAFVLVLVLIVQMVQYIIQLTERK
jgi:TRAP-type transport system small permease protein